MALKGVAIVKDSERVLRGRQVVKEPNLFQKQSFQGLTFKIIVRALKGIHWSSKRP